MTKEALFFHVTVDSNDNCSTFIASGGCSTVSTSGKDRTFDMFRLLKQLQEYYGSKDLSDKRLFLQIRPWALSRPDGSCYTPYVVALNL